MEMSHRTPVYEEIIHTAEANLRKLMSIPDNYKVLFLQGGATTQFSAVPLNLMNKKTARPTTSSPASSRRRPPTRPRATAR